jgi:NADPH:quinone reductase-like Zn-dependent oxidoreductase
MTFPMSTPTIQAIHVHHYGGPEQLKLEQIVRPEPQADEVLVRVYAAGIAPANPMEAEEDSKKKGRVVS